MLVNMIFYSTIAVGRTVFSTYGRLLKLKLQIGVINIIRCVWRFPMYDVCPLISCLNDLYPKMSLLSNRSRLLSPTYGVRLLRSAVLLLSSNTLFWRLPHLSQSPKVLLVEPIMFQWGVCISLGRHFKQDKENCWVCWRRV